MGFPGSILASWYPLQVQLQDFTRPRDPRSEAVAFIVLGAFAAFIVVLIIVNAVKKKYSPSVLGGGSVGGAAAVRHFSSFALHRIANNAGLNRDQARMLEFVLRNDAVVDVERSINSAALLDRHFKRTYRIIERSANTEEEAQERLSLLFSTRNLLEAAGGGGGGISSTRQIPEKSSAVLTVNQESYPVKVVSSKGDHIVVENPQNALGTPIRLTRGGKAVLSFFTRSSKGFSFETRVLGVADAPEGRVLQLIHSNQVKRLAQRRFRRRHTVISASYYFVRLEETGRRKEKKMVVDKRRLAGNIMDISIGGCSIKTNVNVPSGTRLKIEFIGVNNINAAVLGQVLRTNRSGASTIMHIKFLKVPRRSMNAINALVFEYADE
jgi:hypothetical protein